MNIIADIYHAVTGGSKPKADPSPMERLPQDMIVLILQSIDNLRSLRAALLASSAMYDAFRAARTETLACVVSHSRPEEIKSDAVALAVIMNIHEQGPSKVSKALIIDSIINPRRVWAYGPRDLSSPHLLHFHWFVEYFTEKLFKSAMREVHRRGWSGIEKLKFRRLSQNEIIRIQRALYRFELFNSFMRLDMMGLAQLLATVYWKENVSVWDMEEIACIHQLLWQRLSVLDDTIENMVENTTLLRHHAYSESQVSRGKTWIVAATRVVKNLILSQGLATLFKLLSRPESQSTSYRIRDILYKSVRPTVKPERYTQHRFNDVIIYQPDSLFDEWVHGAIPCTLHIDRLRNLQDNTDYPSFGYIRAYRTKTLRLVKAGNMPSRSSMLYHEAEHADDRAWGYCLWDKERMEWWGDIHTLGQHPRERSQLRVTSRGSPRWHTVQLNPRARGG